MKNSTDSLDKRARQIFQDRIHRGMIGPGSDMWGVPDEEELVSDYPLPRYFSGVLFPNKSTTATQSEADDAEGKSESFATDENDDTNEVSKEEQKVPDNEEDVSKKEKPNTIRQDFNLATNSFFPTNIGITVALEKSTKEIHVEFSFGLYTQAKTEERKIKISKVGYDSFFEEGIPYPLPFRNILNYSEGYMFLVRELKGEQKRPKRAEGEYGQFDQFRKTSNLTRQTEEGGYFSAYYYINKL